MRIVTVGAVVFGGRMLGSLFRQVFLLLRMTRKAEIVSRYGGIDFSLVASLFVLMTRIAPFGRCVNYRMLDQLGMTRRAFGLADLFVLGRRNGSNNRPVVTYRLGDGVPADPRRKHCGADCQPTSFRQLIEVHGLSRVTQK